jgi:tryptophan synthase alpha chain
MLEAYIRNQLKTKDILLMTHIVIGYPTLEASYKIVENMVNAGVDIMELQIPFSEPIADGPVILKANQESLSKGITVQKCLDFAATVTKKFSIPFLFMSYYNIIFKYGIKRFADKMVEVGIKGAIVPDLPPEEGKEYIEAMAKNDLDPVFIFTPTTPDKRMSYIESFGKGLIYCIARRGVTGAQTSFSDQINDYLLRCRKATKLPLALGFGVKDAADIQFLKNKADIAVIGSETIRLVDNKGIDAIRDFISGLSRNTP